MITLQIYLIAIISFFIGVMASYLVNYKVGRWNRVENKERRGNESEFYNSILTNEGIFFFSDHAKKVAQERPSKHPEDL